MLIAALADAGAAARRSAHGVLDRGCGVALGLASLDWPKLFASSDRSVYFLLARQAARRDRGAARGIGRCTCSCSVRRDATRAAVFLGAGWCLAGLLLMRAAAVVAPIYSGVDLAAALPRRAARGAASTASGTYDQTLPFYLRRTVKLVAYRGELDYGLRQDPRRRDRRVSRNFVRRVVAAMPQAFAVMEKTHVR